MQSILNSGYDIGNLNNNQRYGNSNNSNNGEVMLKGSLDHTL